MSFTQSLLVFYALLSLPFYLLSFRQSIVADCVVLVSFVGVGLLPQSLRDISPNRGITFQGRQADEDLEFLPEVGGGSINRFAIYKEEPEGSPLRRSFSFVYGAAAHLSAPTSLFVSSSLQTGVEVTLLMRVGRNS